MLHLEPNRIYKIRVTFPESAQTVNDTALGSRIDTELESLQKKYPQYRHIIVFDPDTGDVVALIRK